MITLSLDMGGWEQNQIAFILSVDTSQADEDARRIALKLTKALSLLTQMARLMKRMGLGEDVDDAIDGFIRITQAIQRAYFTLHLFYIASGPVGWAFAGMSFATLMADAMVGY